MIRFSAALVAVAIGVLIGGIATSKLLLVYIAIVVSAVALLVLAIGVVLKRGELFGEEQGPAPTGGSAPAWPAHAGESQVQPRQDASVPPSAPFPGPTGYGAPFAGAGFEGARFEGTAFAGAQAAPPVSAPSADPSTAHRPSTGQGRDRVADPVPSWEAQSAHDQWSSSPWQRGPAVDNPVVDRPAADSTAVERAVADNPVPDGAPDWMTGGRGANGPAVQAEESAPSSPAVPSGAGAKPTPAGPASAGPASAEPAPLSWFDRRPRPTEAAQPAAGTQANATPAAEEPAPADVDTAPAADADAAAAGEDDDWPTRYSWLDDELDESDTPVSPAGDTGTQANDAPGAVTGAVTGTGSAPPTVSGPAFDPGQDTDPSQDTDPAPESVPAAGEPPAADPPGAAEAVGLVSVLRGVPRYHRPDCVLIRFLPEDDIQRLSAAQAKADGCTPCAACQPEE